MKRKALIVKGFSKNSSELVWDKFYVKAYADFFNSLAGGSYTKDEIVVLEDPTLIDLNKTCENLNVDFVVAVFIGHGASQDDSQLFQLNKDEIIYPGDIQFSAPKELLIFESCRNVGNGIPSIKQPNKVARFKAGGKIQFPLSKRQSRKLYDQQLKKCEDGLVLCQACDLSESAYLYFFLNQILFKSLDWHNNQTLSGQVLDIQTLFPVVAKEVSSLASKNSWNQTPKISGTIAFPFAVSQF